MPTPKEKKFNFTDANIFKLPPADAGTRYIVYDASVSGLIVRVNDKANKVFYVYKKMPGLKSPLKIKIEDFNREVFGVEKARAKAEEIRNTMRNGKNPNIEKKRISSDMTIKDFYKNKYKPDHSEVKKKPRTLEIDDGCFNNHLVSLHNQKMLMITREQIESLKKKISKDSGIHSANRMLALLKNMYNKAIDWGFEGKNPIQRIEMFKVSPRKRFIKSDEFQPFFDALDAEENEMFKNFIKALLLTGQRRRNVQAYRWDEIDLGNRLLNIPDPKNGEPLTIKLSNEALELFTEMEKHKTSEWLFPSASSKSGHLEEPKKMWAELLKRAGIEGLRMHDLRRTLGSYTAMSTGDLQIVQQVLGQKSYQSALVYAHYTTEKLQTGVQKATDSMFAFVKDNEDVEQKSK